VSVIPDTTTPFPQLLQSNIELPRIAQIVQRMQGTLLLRSAASEHQFVVCLRDQLPCTYSLLLTLPVEDIRVELCGIAGWILFISEIPSPIKVDDVRLALMDEDVWRSQVAVHKACFVDFLDNFTDGTEVIIASTHVVRFGAFEVLLNHDDPVRRELASANQFRGVPLLSKQCVQFSGVPSGDELDDVLSKFKSVNKEEKGTAL